MLYNHPGFHHRGAGAGKMENRTIYITELDMQRLQKLLEDMEGSLRNKAHLRELENELLRGHVVPSGEVPPDVITMNSSVRLKDMDSGEELTYTLVYPGGANASLNRISILAPIGTALIGYRVGDVIEWAVPSGVRRLKVVEIVYQPEASGDFDL
jgi:regulator of nucleoside diphosphate kinase